MAEIDAAQSLLACAYCAQEMLADDERTLPLHVSGSVPRALCPGSYSVGAPSRSGPMIRKPLVIEDIDAQAAVEFLASPQCLACGGTKKIGKALCIPCFNSLPTDLQPCLYRAVRDGFEGAFVMALELLAEAKAA